jgi:hypothetical protein
LCRYSGCNGLGFSTSITSILAWDQDTTTGRYWDNSYCYIGGDCDTSGTRIEYPVTWVGGGVVFQIAWPCSRSYGGHYCALGHHCTFNFRVADNINDPFGNSGNTGFQYLERAHAPSGAE